MKPPATAVATTSSATSSNPTTTIIADGCVVDRSCVDTGCGCVSTPVPTNAPRRATATRAGLIGLLCILACAAGPLAIGALAAVTGALAAVTGAIAGETWIIAAGLVGAAAVSYYRRSCPRNRPASSTNTPRKPRS